MLIPLSGFAYRRTRHGFGHVDRDRLFLLAADTQRLRLAATGQGGAGGESLKLTADRLLLRCSGR